jgi:dUTP pyrophosphatase
MINRKIKVYYHNRYCKIESFGDWIDLKTAYDYVLDRFDYRVLNLGLSVALPKYYELNIVPRSSTYKNYGVLQTNSFGIIDNEYCGLKDVIGFPALCMTETSLIPAFTRVCQCKVILSQKAPWYIKILDLFTTLKWVEVSTLTGKSRGGFGSTNK